MAAVVLNGRRDKNFGGGIRRVAINTHKDIFVDVSKSNKIDFLNQIRASQTEADKWDKRIIFLILGLLACASLVLIAITFAPRLFLSPDTSFYPEFKEIAIVTNKIDCQILISIILAIVIPISIIIVITFVISYIVNCLISRLWPILTVWFIKSRKDRDYYLQTSVIINDNYKKWTYIAASILVIAMIGSGTLMAYELREYEFIALIPRLRIWASVWFYGMVSIVGIPYIKAAQKLSIEPTAWKSVWRVAQWKMFYLFGGIIFLFLFILFLLPALCDLSNIILQKWLTPWTRFTIENIVNDFHKEILPTTDLQRKGVQFVHKFSEQRVNGFMTSLSENGSLLADSKFIADKFGDLLVYYALGLFAAIGFVPLFLQQPAISFLYYSLFVLAFALEVLINKLLGAITMLPSGSLTVIILILCMSFVNSFMFDEIGKKLTDKVEKIFHRRERNKRR